MNSYLKEEAELVGVEKALEKIHLFRSPIFKVYVFAHIQFFVSLAVSNIKKLHLKDFSISFSFFYSHLFVSEMFDARFLLSSAKIFSPEGRTTTKLLKIIILTFCPAIDELDKGDSQVLRFFKE